MDERLVTRRRRAPSISPRVYGRPRCEPILGQRSEDSDAVVALPQMLAFSPRHRTKSPDAGQRSVRCAATVSRCGPDVERALNCFGATPQGELEGTASARTGRDASHLLIGRELSKSDKRKMCSEVQPG